MSIDLPLDTMTTAEKLEAMEAIWASLCREPIDVVTPDWHARLLAERKQRLASGEATVSDWSEARKRLQNLGQ